MDILDLLVKIGMNEEHISYFSSGYILRPQLSKKKNELIITLKVKQILPFRVWLDCKNKFEAFSETSVVLVIEGDNEELLPVDVKEYISYYDLLSGESYYDYLIPEVVDNTVNLFHYENVNVEGLSGLENFLKSCGMKCMFNKKEKVNEDITVERTTNSLYTKRESNGYYNNSFDIADYIYLPLANLEQEVENVYVKGRVFDIEVRTSKKNKAIQIIKIHEGNDALTVKRFEGKRFSKQRIDELNKGDYIQCFGSITYDMYSQELSMLVEELVFCDAPDISKDEAKIKRVELHAHTNMSEMDGVCECSELVEKAYAFGHKAVTIMDSMVVQAYPDAQNTYLKLSKKDEKRDFKVIYGIEMNMVDEVAQIVINPTDKKLKHETYVVFDLETTGLSNEIDEIIEFGAVKIKDGNEIGRMQMFIKPSEPISQFTENLTGITNEDVMGADSIRTVIPKIIEFFGDSTLVAHNAGFDHGFMNSVLAKLDMPALTNPVIDTLPLSWVLFPERRRYALGYLVRGYNIVYDADAAHRADYDSEVLAHAFHKMLNDIVTDDGMTLHDLQNLQTSDIFMKLFSRPVSIIAKNYDGVKSIYELVTLSHSDYLISYEVNSEKGGKNNVAEPRILRSEIEKRRANLLVGTNGYNSEVMEIAKNRSYNELVECMKFYDYVEIQPLCNYNKLLVPGSSYTKQRLINTLQTIIKVAKQLNKMIVATSDSHYVESSDKLIHEIYISSQRIGGARHPLFDRRHRIDAPEQHFRTTEEMLKEFDYLDEKEAYQYVVTNTNLIADSVENYLPLQTELHTPKIDGCEDDLTKIVYDNAYHIYGNPLPEIVSARIDKELGSVTKHGFSVQYYIAHLLVKRSLENGYVVGSRGSVGSSLIATLANITEVNPLDPHYVCLSCNHSEFFTKGEYASGFDLPNKLCPICNSELKADGHSIPFETFLGFQGDKVPDIDLNFSGEYQMHAQQQVKEIFGETHVFAAGTVSTVANKTAFGYIKGYCETKNIPMFNKAKMEFLAKKCEGVKRTTGQHPGGIVVCPKEMEAHDFTPVQFPANNPSSNWMTTHFAIKDIHDNILKLDVLGHVDPTAVKLLHEMSGVNPVDVPIHDEKTMSLFNSTEALNIVDKSIPYKETTGAVGLPEFGTQFIRGILEMTKPSTFAELVSLSGLTHGTDVWLNNAKDLITAGTCTLSQVIGCRDDIMVYLIQKGLAPKLAFDIMESVRKGKGVRDEWVSEMYAHDVPTWYVDSCRKIKYMFPKAHAVAYVMMAVRIAWFKANMPIYYYAVYFSCRCDSYDIRTMINGVDAISARMQGIETRIKEQDRTITNKEREIYSVLEVSYEMQRRGFTFTNVDLMKSEAGRFVVDKNDPTRIIPPFDSIDGLGKNVALSIVEERKKKAFISKEDLMKRTQINNTLLKELEDMGVLKNLQDTNQMNLFDF